MGTAGSMATFVQSKPPQRRDATRLGWIAISLAASTIISSAASPDLIKDIEIPYSKFVLKNGLTLIVHEDHKAPIVAVNVWYHVGSKNEKPGKTGFAHLFEHLMFNGSEHFNDDFFKATEKVGATDMNGTTNPDRTNYFENAPKDALDLLLWLESDRMGHLLGVIDQARLDEQRGVVQNEKRQGENQPYGISRELITKGTFPPGHPYSWTTIGSMEDLNAASVQDVHDWFKTYYGAANATLVIAGDVNAPEVREKVEKYFGDIPAGPPLARHSAWIAKRTGVVRQLATDRVPQSRIYKVWNIPQFGTLDGDHLNLVSDVLAAGKNSRLYKRLVYDEQIASNVSAYVDLQEIAGTFVIQATARPGEELSKIERAIDEELARFIADGPTATELQRVKTENLAGFIREIERIGGFGGKSDVLAQYQVYTGSPENYKIAIKRTSEATAQDLQRVAKSWLSDGVYILEVHPFPKYETTQSSVDRSKLPFPDLKPEAKFPNLQRASLPNGLKIVLAERHTIPVVEFEMLIDAGYAADQFAKPGTAKLAMDMLDEGTKSRTSLQISEELAQLGASLLSGSDLDVSSVSLSALKANLDPSLAVFADVILNPSFPEEDFKRLQKKQLDQIKQEKVQPNSMAARVFPKLLYGSHHAYGNPFTGSGDEANVAKFTRSDLEKFHRTWFKADNATLIVVGDTTLSEITPKLETIFKGWDRGAVPKKNIGAVELAPKSVIYLIDRPGSIQTLILAGHIGPPKSNPEEVAIEAMNQILGGAFTSRINMNLRENKHWSYGAGTRLLPARGQRPFYVSAPVQTDKTKESIVEITKELNGLFGDRPITEEELNKTRENRILKLPGAWETMNAVGNSIVEIVRFGLPDNYFQSYPAKVGALTLEDLKHAAQTVVHPDRIMWVIVGDRSKIESGIRELGIGEIRLIDVDGNPVN